MSEMRAIFAALFFLAAAGIVLATVNGSITVVSPSDDSLLNESVQVNVTYDGTANVTLEYNTSAGSFNHLETSNADPSPYEFTWETSNGSFADGLYSLRFTIINSSNSSDNETVFSHNLTVDNTAPNVTGIVSNDSDNVSRSDVAIVINATVADLNSIQSVIIYNTSSSSMSISGAVYQYSGTLANLGCVSEGNCLLTVNATDNFGNTNSTETLTLTVLNTSPSVLQTSPANAANLTSTSVNFTWSANSTQDNSIECTLFVDGSSNATVFGNETLSQAVNLSQGSGNWSVTCTDSADNSNSTVTRTYSVDSQAPVVTGSDGSITVSSAVITSSSTESSTFTIFHGTTSGSLTTTTSGGSGTSTTTTLSSLSSGTTYYYRVQGCDLAGNCANSTQDTFTTTSASTGRSGGGGSGSGALSVEISQDPLRKVLSRYGSTNFMVPGDGITHRLIITDIEERGVNFKIYSDPIEVFLSKGESAELDVTGDGVIDVLLSLIDFTSTVATVELSLWKDGGLQTVPEQVDQTAPDQEVSLPEDQTTVQQVHEKEEVPQETLEVTSERSSSSGWILAVAGVLLAGLIALWYFVRKA